MGEGGGVGSSATREPIREKGRDRETRAEGERVEFAARVKGGTRSTRDARIRPLDIFSTTRDLLLFLPRQDETW